ncbi:Mov34/MPN/PAD-1 family protein [Sphingomonas oryzagri]
MTVRISRGVLQRILAHAANEPVREVCGLLLGSPLRVENARETANVALDPASAFEIDPATLFGTLRAERAGGPRILGHYHSHPNGSPTPSARDAVMALQPGRLWLIVARGEARMWCEWPGGAMHGAFDPVELVVDDAQDGCT